jgi:hypothetical protein
LELRKIRQQQQQQQQQRNDISNIATEVKQRKTECETHVAHMKKMRNAYKVLVGKPEGKIPLGRLWCRWEDNLKMDLGGIWRETEN